MDLARNRMTENRVPLKLRGCLGVTLCAVAFLALVFLYFNWGIWRSKSYVLLGVDLPIETVYRTDLSGRQGRDAGYFVVVYQLPADTQEQLEEREIDLAQYPMFRAGFERDGYKRVKWTKDFPRNNIEKHIFSHFRRDAAETEPPRIQHINSDEDAELLANHLLQSPRTMCGGWYNHKSGYMPGHIWIPSFYFYVMNMERQTLIMFALDT